MDARSKETIERKLNELEKTADKLRIPWVKVVKIIIIVVNAVKEIVEVIAE